MSGSFIFLPESSRIFHFPAKIFKDLSFSFQDLWMSLKILTRILKILKDLGKKAVRAWIFFQVLFTTTRFSSVLSCEDLIISSLKILARKPKILARKLEILTQFIRDELESHPCINPPHIKQKLHVGDKELTFIGRSILLLSILAQAADPA